jgi:hypothetical protein
VPDTLVLTTPKVPSPTAIAAMLAARDLMTVWENIEPPWGSGAG